MPLSNFGIVYTSHIATLYRCAQPDAKGFSDLYKLGVRVMYKLNNDKEFHQNQEKDLFCGDVHVDTFDGLMRFNDEIQVMQAAKNIQNYLGRGLSVAVHCTHGRDRTGLVIAAWRIMFSNWTLDRVYAERSAYGVNRFVEIVDVPDRKTLAEIYRLTRDFSPDD